MATLPLPVVGQGDVDYYIALLLGAADDWLKRDDNWLEDDYDAALQHIENLKAWLAEVPTMTQLFTNLWHCPGAAFEWGITNGAMSITAGAFPHGNHAFQLTATNNDFCRVQIFLPAGSYTLDYWYLAQGDTAIIDFRLDGEIVLAGLDQYGAQVVSKYSFVLPVPTDGPHLLEIRANGKRAASTGYRIRCASVIISQASGGGGG